MLAETPVRRLLPAEFRLDRADLETWLRLAVPLTADETAAAPLADEEADASVEVARLQGELRRIEVTIDTLRAVSIGGSEAASPAAASEDGADDRETSLRGE